MHLNNNFFNNNSSSNLNKPAILTSDDVQKLRNLQDEFCAECGKNITLVAYQR